MKREDMFPSKYLNADSLVEDAPLDVTVSHVRIEAVKEKDNSESDKAVMYFKELEKPLILNKTNWLAMEKIAGNPDSDFWAGTPIKLVVEQVDAFGEMKNAIRIKDPKGDLVGLFWSKAREVGLQRKEGLEVLKEAGNDFAKAIELLNAPA